MFKKLVFMSVCICATMHATTPVTQLSVLSYENANFNPAFLPQDTLGDACSWLLVGGKEKSRAAVAGLVAYCIVYTLYQTAKGVGSTVWTWWKGEHLSEAMRAEVEAYVSELIKQKNEGHLAVRRVATHHDAETCNCGECSEARRVRE